VAKGSPEDSLVLTLDVGVRLQADWPLSETLPTPNHRVEKDATDRASHPRRSTYRNEEAVTTRPDSPKDSDTRTCPQCGQLLTRVSAFWICPTHGQLPEPKSLLRIFLSYGHDANEELVHRIKSDLEKRGHIWPEREAVVDCPRRQTKPKRASQPLPAV
jgi:hypothetical protein